MRSIELEKCSGILLSLCACAINACSDNQEEPSFEGDAAGECADDSDNDRDGLFDCQDPDCWGSPVCKGRVDTSSSNSSDNADTEGADTEGGDSESPDTDEDSEYVNVDSSDASRVSGYIDTLPWGQDVIDEAGKRDEFIDAVIKSCAEFAPPEDDWQIWCQAFLVAAACRESSLDTTVVKGTDTSPTVGLLQVSFQYGIHEYDMYGKKTSLQRIGCDWPDFSEATWETDGPQWVEWLQGIQCNVAVGAWAYFLFAGGNGSPPCYVYQYCQGQGTSANLVVGMLSYLNGPAAASFDASDPYPNTYVSWTKEWFDAMITPAPDPHPFLREIQPNPDQYCE